VGCGGGGGRFVRPNNTGVRRWLALPPLLAISAHVCPAAAAAAAAALASRPHSHALNDVGAPAHRSPVAAAAAALLHCITSQVAIDNNNNNSNTERTNQNRPNQSADIPREPSINQPNHHHFLRQTNNHPRHQHQLRVAALIRHLFLI
jgi:hypothetical protein